MAPHKKPAVDNESIEALIKEQIESQPEHWLAAAPTTCGNAMALLAHAKVFDLQRRTQAQSQSSQALEQYREQRLGSSTTRRFAGCWALSRYWVLASACMKCCLQRGAIITAGLPMMLWMWRS